MNIHEHQAKQILKKYGAVVPKGVFALTVDDLLEKVKSLKTDKYVLKAQIDGGGRGKAGVVKIFNTIEDLASAAKEFLGKNLIISGLVVKKFASMCFILSRILFLFFK